MKMNQLNEIVVDENDLVEGLLQGKSAKYIVTKDTEKVDSYNHFCTLFKFEDTIDYETPAATNDKYSYKNADNWWMPEKFKQMNIVDYILGLSPKENYDRCFEELEEFEEHDEIEFMGGRNKSKSAFSSNYLQPNLEVSIYRVE